MPFPKVDPSPKQKEFFKAQEKYILYGGAKGGGKSWALRWKQILRRKVHKHSRGLLLRRTYPELLRNHIYKIREEIPPQFYTYNEQKHIFTFPNGATLEMGACQYEQDVFIYQGSEYDDIALDEAGQFTRFMYDHIKTSLRTTRTDLKTQMYLGSNPGGVGHGWLRDEFMDKQLPDHTFISAKVWDNPKLMEADPGYVEELKLLPEAMRKMYLEGSWDVFAGQAFPQFNIEKHVTQSPQFEINRAKKVIGFDAGYNDPGCAIWVAFGPERHILAYREIYASGKTPEEWAKEIKAIVDTEQFDYIVLPHDCFSKRDGRTSIADTFRHAGIGPIREAKNTRKGYRQNSYMLMHQYLSDSLDGTPYLQMTPRCTNLIRTLPDLMIDLHKEDVNTEGEDHAYDAIRLALMSQIEQTQGAVISPRLPHPKQPQITISREGTYDLPDFWDYFKNKKKNRGWQYN